MRGCCIDSRVLSGDAFDMAFLYGEETERCSFDETLYLICVLSEPLVFVERYRDIFFRHVPEYCLFSF